MPVSKPKRPEEEPVAGLPGPEEEAHWQLAHHSGSAADQPFILLPPEGLQGKAGTEIWYALTRCACMSGVMRIAPGVVSGNGEAAWVLVMAQRAGSSRPAACMIDASGCHVRQLAGVPLRDADIARLAAALAARVDAAGSSLSVASDVIAAPRGAVSDATRPPEPKPAAGTASARAMRNAAILVAALAVLGALIIHALHFERDPSQKVDLDVRAQYEGSLLEWRTFRVLKQRFPNDYEDFLSSLASGRVSLDSGLLPAGTGLIKALKAREQKHFANAPLESLRQGLRAQADLLQYLKEGHGPRACTEMAVHGLASAMRLIGGPAREDAGLRNRADTLLLRYFEAAADGANSPVSHEALTERHWQDFAAYLLTQGIREADLKVFADPARSVDDPEACDSFIKVIGIVIRPGLPAVEPVIPFVAASAAAVD